MIGWRTAGKTNGKGSEMDKQFDDTSPDELTGDKENATSAATQDHEATFVALHQWEIFVSRQPGRNPGAVLLSRNGRAAKDGILAVIDATRATLRLLDRSSTRPTVFNLEPLTVRVRQNGGRWQSRNRSFPASSRARLRPG